MSESKKLSSEVASKLDLSVIRYSRVLEDHRVLSAALKIALEQDIVLSISSSGDNVLNLLLHQPRKIVAVDMSVAQTSILELKLAAIRHLSYDDCLLLLGEVVASGEEREAAFLSVKEYLPAEAKVFWEGRLDAIREGLAMSGRLLKYVQIMVAEKLLKTVGEQTMDNLMCARSMEEQRKIVESIPMEEVELIIRAASDKKTLEKGRSAAQQKYLEDVPVDDIAWKAFKRCFTDVSFNDNFYFSWACLGGRGYNPKTRPNFAPPYLREENFQALKGLIDRIEIHTSSLEDYLNLPNTPVFNKVNLSNMFEYMSNEDTETFFNILSDHMAPSARVAYWNLYLPRIPLKCPSLHHLKELSEELYKTDRMFFYSNLCILEKTI